jgi:hypothetical protein
MNTFRPAKGKVGETNTHGDEQAYNGPYSATDGNQDDNRRLAEPRIFFKYDLPHSFPSV